MKHLYVVNPVDCQPQWPSKPQPIHHPWVWGYSAVGLLSGAFVAVVVVLRAAWLLGGGS